MVCDCLVELTNVFIDKTFTYLVPKSLENDIKVGMRITVPFGSQTLEGFVMSLRKKTDEQDLKEVISLVDSYPILNEELLFLGKYISKVTLSSLMSAYSCMLPKALKAKHKVNMNIIYDKYVSLNKDINLKSFKLNENAKNIIEYIKDKDFVKKEELKEFSKSTIKTLLNKNILIETCKEHYRYNLKEKNKQDFNLNEEQQNVYDEIIKNKSNFNTYLIHGITGSGKTNVYMKLIENILNEGKTAIMLVPEISLTPQIIERFTTKFDKIAVLHSGLSDGEKYDEWRKIKEGKVNIVIGARSAVFAPLENLGIIIIDEEHSSTYKQENAPRYNAIDVAKKRCEFNSCPLVLGSATPSLESYARGVKGVYKLLELKTRFNKKPLPKVEVVDMNKEFKKNNSFFSDKLLDEIKLRIEKDEQVILFLNKRGYSSTLTCRGCGNTIKCPNCDITLTYHKSSNMLRCHYCGYADKRMEKCSCGETFKDFGIGTEKVEEELSKLVEGSKIIRMDVDTTTKKNSVAKIIEDFSNKKYNILLGTQMISKGLDFSDVTLVGIINADIGLNYPDFRSSETTYSLLEQVLGRSGRSEKEGSVIIQTFNPEHYAINYTINHDYIGFFNKEMSIRRKLDYPPYYYLCVIRIISKEYDVASSESSKISSIIKNNLKNEIILGPSVCNLFKLNNNYRFQIIIKYKDINNIIPILTELQNHYFGNRKVRVEIDFNPYKL